MNAIQSFISKIILLSFLIFTSIVLILAKKYMLDNYINFNHPLKFVAIFLILFGILGCIYFVYKLESQNEQDNKYILYGMIIVFAFAALIWINLVPSEQVSDFGNFWLKAPGILQGDKLSDNPNDYFGRYAYQSGFMIYILLVVKIFGFNVIYMQLLNVFFLACILLVTYKISIQLFHNIKIARITVLLLIFNLDWFALSNQADNQYLGSLLFLISFNLVLKDSVQAYILAGFTLAIGNIVRPVGPPILAGIVVFFILFTLIKNNSIDLKAIRKIVLLLSIYVGLIFFVGIMVKATGLNSHGLKNFDPEWKFVTGLHYESNGTYSDDLNRIIEEPSSREEMHALEKNQIDKQIAYLNGNQKWFELFINKVGVLWSQQTSAIVDSGFNTKHSTFNSKLVDIIGYAGSLLTIVFSWIGSIHLFKVKKNSDMFVLILPVLAFAVIELFIEVQGRYRIEFLPLLVIFAGMGLFEVFESVDKVYKKFSDNKSSLKNISELQE